MQARSSLLTLAVPLVGAILAALAAPGSARACGPDFPPELLTRREEVLSLLPDGVFSEEVAQLVPRPPGRYVVEAEDGAEPKDAREGGGEKERALYARGARAFRAGHGEAAARSFAAVLALPEGQRRHFSTFAAFMLGRMGPESARWFGEVRRLAAAGLDDPLGLALASLGEEARRKLDPAAYAVAGEEAPARDDAAAVHLYAQQASLGSRRAATSLLFVARALVGDPERLGRALADPVVQRLITTYAWTRGGDAAWSTDPPRYPVAPLLERLAAVPHLAGADRLAAAAWRAGRFDLAERFAGAEETPLAAWVKAKLALRAGDRARADQLLADAEAHTPVDAVWSDWEWRWPLSVRGRLEGERCILALARDDRAAAFEHALASGYWTDVAYLAERVLEVGELEAAVDRGARPAAAPGAGGPAIDDEGDAWSPGDPGKRLRDLLARRLMREGKRSEALRYYARPAVAAQARAYAAAVEAAGKASGVDRAQALYQAARLVRAAGMEIMGTELAPDWASLGGYYDPGAFLVDRPKPTPLSPPLTTDAERRRAASHAPAHDLRFHYRAVAADHAEAAAALVPPRSQAFAALLCQAAQDVRAQDPARFSQLWRAYVRKGAMVPFAPTFGVKCPAPDFERARHPFTRRSAFHMPRKRTLALWGSGVLAIAALAVAGIRRAARRRGARPPAPAPSVR